MNIEHSAPAVVPSKDNLGTVVAAKTLAAIILRIAVGIQYWHDRYDARIARVANLCAVTVIKINLSSPYPSAIPQSHVTHQANLGAMNELTHLAMHYD